MFRRIDPSPPSGTQPRSPDRARRESRFRLEPLEDRLLLSGDFLGVAAWQDADGSVDEFEIPALFEREAETSSDADAKAQDSPSINWGGDANSEDRAETRILFYESELDEGAAETDAAGAASFEGMDAEDGAQAVPSEETGTPESETEATEAVASVATDSNPLPPELMQTLLSQGGSAAGLDLLDGSRPRGPPVGADF